MLWGVFVISSIFTCSSGELIFHPESVAKLVSKFKSGHTTSTKDNIALVGIVSTQLMVHKFLEPIHAETPDLAARA